METQASPPRQSWILQLAALILYTLAVGFVAYWKGHDHAERAARDAAAIESANTVSQIHALERQLEQARSAVPAKR